jgi:hypothetical protein
MQAGRAPDALATLIFDNGNQAHARLATHEEVLEWLASQKRRPVEIVLDGTVMGHEHEQF